MERTFAKAGSISNARRTTHELVLEMLRQRILSGELAAGSRLVQSELALSMEVSTTPVREALRDLASDGLIRLDPHIGAVVQGLSSFEFQEIYEVRMLLEPMAARKASGRMTAELLDRLKQIHHRMEEEKNPAHWVQLNRNFHLTICETGVSPRIATIIRSLQDASVMYIGVALGQPGLLGEANRGHGAIVSALRAGDPDAAAEATLLHLQSSMKAFDSRRDDESTIG
jgi:DNA-binding GntR family transcriptional regulator